MLGQPINIPVSGREVHIHRNLIVRSGHGQNASIPFWETKCAEAIVLNVQVPDCHSLIYNCNHLLKEAPHGSVAIPGSLDGLCRHSHI